MNNKHRQDRAHLLRCVGRHENSNRCPRMIINSLNYAPVPPPLNLQTHPSGDCLIWLGKINKDGYGTGTFLGGEQLAHRQAFKQSGRTIGENSQVLHLCHQPYCVQPSHLYAGSSRDNASDRRLQERNDADLELRERKSAIANSAAKYRWPTPSTVQPPLMNPSTTDVGPTHICRYSDWAGDRRICRVCGNAEDFRSDWGLGPKKLQPRDTTGNSRLQYQRRRQFTDLDDGLTIKVDTETAIDIPTNRAEWRRRERDAKKQPKHPALLDRRTIDLSEEPHTNAQGVVPPEALPLVGPGLLVMTMRPVPRK